MYDSLSQKVHSTTLNPSLYTGKERDQESGNDFFGARYYVNTMGRFLTPDWSAKIEPVPYAKLDIHKLSISMPTHATTPL